MFGDLMEKFEEVKLPADAVSRPPGSTALTKDQHHAQPLSRNPARSMAACWRQGDEPLIYMEDVGRHNAVDKIAGYMFLNGIAAEDKIFYTTGRLTSEMVIKTVQTRSGFTAWGVDLARQADLTLIGRAKGKRFVALAGGQRIVFDADPASVADEDRRCPESGPPGGCVKTTPLKVLMQEPRKTHRNVLDVIDAALDEHNEWLNQWHRAVVCGIDPAREVISENAHLISRFGFWFDLNKDRGLVNQAAFRALSRAQADCYVFGRELAGRAANREPVPWPIMTL